MARQDAGRKRGILFPRSDLPTFLRQRGGLVCTQRQKRKTAQPFGYAVFWRRRRDSNPRDPLGAYMISNHAPSTN